MLQFRCCIHSVRVDKDGEATITLKVPLSDLAQVLKLTEHTEQVLYLTVDTANQ